MLSTAVLAKRTVGNVACGLFADADADDVEENCEYDLGFSHIVFRVGYLTKPSRDQLEVQGRECNCACQIMQQSGLLQHQRRLCL